MLPWLTKESCWCRNYMVVKIGMLEAFPYNARDYKIQGLLHAKQLIYDNKQFQRNSFAFLGMSKTQPFSQMELPSEVRTYIERLEKEIDYTKNYIGSFFLKEEISVEKKINETRLANKSCSSDSGKYE